MARVCKVASPAAFSLKARAKINLTLEVLGKRPDGYHEIRSVMQTISLADTITFSGDTRMSFTSDDQEWDAEKSLVRRAAHLLKEKTGTDAGARITVEKRIPLMSGLGGDSSDAAVVLIGLNRLWKTGIRRNRLVDLGTELGSDVAFFFRGGTALVEGRGEIISPLPVAPRFWLVLLMPELPRVPGKTMLAYQGLKAHHFTDGQITGKSLSALQSGEKIDGFLLFNTFENIVFQNQPEVTRARDHMLAMGAPNVHLSGTGPVLYSIISDETRARQLLSRLKVKNFWSVLARTV